MPTSHLAQIPAIISEVRYQDPHSILDIGVGFGKYGFLAREYLELWDGRDSLEWVRVIDGIEAYEPYITDVQRGVYDTIHIGDALDVLPTLGSYDLILLIDCLEHFEKADGGRLLTEALSHGPVLVSVPRFVNMEQVDAFCNPYETHRSSWSLSELREFSPLRSIRDEASLICLLGGIR